MKDVIVDRTFILFQDWLKQVVIRKKWTEVLKGQVNFSKNFLKAKQSAKAAKVVKTSIYR